jgi:hypothetical protein
VPLSRSWPIQFANFSLPMALPRSSIATISAVSGMAASSFAASRSFSPALLFFSSTSVR